MNYRYTFQTANFRTVKIFKQKKPLRAAQYTSVRASRRDAPESLKIFPPLGLVRPRRGRAGCRVPDAPAALCAKGVARPRTSILSGGTGKPGNPARDVLQLIPCSPRGGALLRPSPFGLRFVCARLGRRASAGLDPSIRGGTTRLFSPLRYRSSCATFESSQPHSWCVPPCQLRSRPIPPRPSHLIPRL